ncbi:MAG: Gfo/Idh/MocA family oxidoreductase [Pirellulaceae bacterium]
MKDSKVTVNRRAFMEGSAAGVAAFSIVPRHVLGRGQTPPSEKLGAALIGCGGRGPGTVKGLGDDIHMVACCDADLRRAENAAKRFACPHGVYQDYRLLLERNDVDVVAIATHPGWHALISMAAMEAGKDVLCEKPMTHFISEGRAVVETEKRYARIFQIGTFGRYGASRDPQRVQIHKIMASGLLKDCQGVHVKLGGLKVAQWSGKVTYDQRSVPDHLDWDLYCGPSPLRPFQPHRLGGTHRGYWDYEGGGLTDMAQHHFDPVVWTYAKDATSPVEIEASAPPAHPEACAMWGWVELRYADGLTLVMDSKEWGDRYDRRKPREVRLGDLSEEDQAKIRRMPDPEPLIHFAEAVKTRKKPGGHAEAAHRTATLMHLANIAIRTGRKIQYDPVAEQIIGDEEANRLAHQPMRAPWRV